MREIHRASRVASMRMKTEHEALAMGVHRMIWSSTRKRLNRKDASQVFLSGNDCILEPLDISC